MRPFARHVSGKMAILSPDFELITWQEGTAKLDFSNKPFELKQTPLTL